MFKFVLKNMTLLNFILLTGITFFVFLRLLPEINFTPDIKVKPLKKASQTDENNVSNQNEISQEPISAYMDIPEKNLFHPERKIVLAPPPEPPPVEEVKEPVAEPNIVLYGTLIYGDIRKAYLEDKTPPSPENQNPPIVQPPIPQQNATPQTKEKPTGKLKYQVLEIGGTIGGYAIKEINIDDVILNQGDKELHLYVYKPDKVRSAPPVQNQKNINAKTQVQNPIQNQNQNQDPNANNDAFMKNVQEERQRRLMERQKKLEELRMMRSQQQNSNDPSTMRQPNRFRSPAME